METHDQHQHHLHLLSSSSSCPLTTTPTYSVKERSPRRCKGHHITWLWHHHIKRKLSLTVLLFCTFILASDSISVSSDTLKDNTDYKPILDLLKSPSNDSANRLRVHRMIASYVERVLWKVDKLHQLDYGHTCDSFDAETARHNLTNLIGQVTQTPREDLLSQISSTEEEILKRGKSMCDYSRGLSCDEKVNKCSCYTGHRYEDIIFEPVREKGVCKLDEMSRCYSPTYLVSRGALVIHCINGAKCVGDLTGRRCNSPVMSENCHCQFPCPDGSFTNLMDELRKCIAKLDEISVLQFNDSCTPKDQEERDDVVQVLETSGSEKAGPIIRGIKKLLASNHFLCSPEDQLVCHPELSKCVCGPERDGVLYQRVNDTCLWAKGSRCFPEDIYANVTGSNGTCVEGTQCFMEGEAMPCDPNFEEPLCYCQDPEDLESSMVGLVVVLILLVLSAGGVVGFLIHAKIISCPLGGSPANV